MRKETTKTIFIVQKRDSAYAGTTFPRLSRHVLAYVYGWHSASFLFFRACVCLIWKWWTQVGIMMSIMICEIYAWAQQHCTWEGKLFQAIEENT